jgi:hypothetical protein
MFLFEKWFVELALPRLKRSPGKKLIIGDNLASHISPNVIKLCKDNDISFVCLPPNSTDKLQPLDVGVFAPLKKSWRLVLSTFKKEYPKEVGIPKCVFPSLLKKLLDTCNPGQYLAAAFDRCGLYPINPSRGMERIPSRDMEEDEGTVRALLSATFGEKLEELRGVGDLEKKKRGKKVTTAPGLSFTEQLESDDSEAEFLIGVPRKSRRVESSEESEEESDVDVDALLGGEGDGLSRSGQIDVESEESEVENFDEWLAEGGEGSSKPKRSSRAVGSSKVVGSSKEKSSKVVGGRKQAEMFPVGGYVAAVYDGDWYVAQVEGEEPEEETEGYTLLKYMERKGNNQFVWGSGKDTLKTINKDILCIVDPPIPVSSRLWGLPKDVVKNIEKILRVKWSILLVLNRFFLWCMYF